MKRVMLVTILVLMAQFAFSDAQAEDPTLPITPGLYTVTSKTSSNLNPEPKIQIMDVCIDAPVLDPSGYLPSAANCSLDNVKKDGNKASFDISCQSTKRSGGTPGMPEMKGKGDCSTTQTELYCHFKMVLPLQEEEFTIDSVRQGRRVGDCPDLE